MALSYTVLALILASLAHSPALAQVEHPTVFRSHDRGLTWSPSATGLPSGVRVNAFVSAGPTVIAGTDRGIYISPGQGRTWKPAGPPARVLALATLLPAVYAGTAGAGLLVSSDHGLTWTPAPSAPFRYVRALVSLDGTLFAGTDAQGVFLSRDGARSWTPINGGLPPAAQVFALAASEGKLYAGLYAKGLYVWSQPARIWRKLGPVSPLVLAVSGPALLTGHNPGGIFRSGDGGATWQQVRLPASLPLGNAPVWAAGAGAQLALFGVANSVLFSQDQGLTWTSAQSGLPGGSAGIAFLVDPRFALAAVSLPKRP